MENGPPSSRGAESRGRRRPACVPRRRGPGSARGEGAAGVPAVAIASPHRAPAPLEISLPPLLQVRQRRHGSEGLSESLCRLQQVPGRRVLRFYREGELRLACLAVHPFPTPGALRTSLPPGRWGCSAIPCPGCAIRAGLHKDLSQNVLGRG